MDRKKVIKALEYAWEYIRERPNPTAFPKAMAMDGIKKGIAMLKEQEPHLLDISEIYTAHKLDVWIEEKGDNTVHTLMLVETEMTDKRQVAFFFPMIVRPVKAYGKTWRCWSARPTDEQRKAVKWDD